MNLQNSLSDDELEEVSGGAFKKASRIAGSNAQVMRMMCPGCHRQISVNVALRSVACPNCGKEIILEG